MSDERRLQIDRRQLLLTAAGAVALNALAKSAAIAGAVTRVNPGRQQLFDLNWRIRRSGAGESFETTDVDDSAWRVVDLPHDWSIEDLPADAGGGGSPVIGPFTRASKEGTAVGFTLGGEAWYRKRFQLDRPANGRVEVLFEGVYMDSDVWLNGQHLGNLPNGYRPFIYDLTPHLSATGDNVLAVRVRNTGANSRWYAGSGIYRHVWLDVFAETVRIARWGVNAVTRTIVDSRAQIEITSRVEAVVPGLKLISRIKDSQGRVVQEVSTAANGEVNQAVTLRSPRLWSPQDPYLYTLETQLRRGSELLDRDETPFGIRIVKFDAAQGMTINGVSTKLRGGCIHHDNGLLGAAAFDGAEERKVELLKARGFNAVRPSHNMFSETFLRTCDRHGMLVIAETFDVWHEAKLPQDYSIHFDHHWRSDLATMVMSARNHPSVIMWSIGNEIPGRNTQRGLRTHWELANEVHRLDPTRPVTAAINGFVGRPVVPSSNTARLGQGNVAEPSSVVFLDVIGYNYKLADYEADHARYANRVLYGSESFPKDVAAIWELTNRSPWLIGDFVWTAMDYLGEAGIGGSVIVAEKNLKNPLATMAAWPWVNAFCGDIDLIGNQKPQSLARDVIWGLSDLEVTVQRPVPDGEVDMPRIWGWADEQPSWTWPGAEGRQLAVRVYTTGDRVDVHLNGRKLDSKPVSAAVGQCTEFAVPYEPGALAVVAFRNGKQIARKQHVTVGTPTEIRLRPERSKHGAARGEVSHVAVEIVDAAGHVVPNISKAVEIAINGAGELLAFGSGNPLAVGSYQSRVAQTWNGRGLLVVRGTGRTGRVTIEARADGLRAASTALRLV